MSTKFDVTEAVDEVRWALAAHGFAPRDADHTDFQSGTDSTLRFKVGTRYGEVTVQIVREDRPVEPIRATNSEGLVRVINRVDALATAHNRAIK